MITNLKHCYTKNGYVMYCGIKRQPYREIGLNRTCFRVEMG